MIANPDVMMGSSGSFYHAVHCLESGLERFQDWAMTFLM